MHREFKQYLTQIITLQHNKKTKVITFLFIDQKSSKRKKVNNLLVSESKTDSVCETDLCLYRYYYLIFASLKLCFLALFVHCWSV